MLEEAGTLHPGGSYHRLLPSLVHSPWHCASETPHTGWLDGMSQYFCLPPSLHQIRDAWPRAGPCAFSASLVLHIWLENIHGEMEVLLIHVGLPHSCVSSSTFGPLRGLDSDLGHDLWDLDSHVFLELWLADWTDEKHLSKGVPITE